MDRIPPFQEILFPLLKLTQDQKVYTTKEILPKLSEIFGLIEDDLLILLPSGTQPLFYNRVNRAKSYLKMAGFLSYPQRGSIAITEEGL